MNIGVLGLGKLGLPVALALEQAGHQVVGWDASAERRGQINDRRVPEAAHEPHLGEYLAQSRLKLRPYFWTDRPEVVLVCVQTPHQPEFEGVTPLDRPPEDFDYTWLWDAVRLLAGDIRTVPDWDPLVVVVSTCLPGTFDRELRPLIAQAGIRFAYHPLFIAMGSVIDDFRDPEFVLIGTDDEQAPVELQRMYQPVLRKHRHPVDDLTIGYVPAPRFAPFRTMSIASAELTKVAYNTFLGLKLMLANGVAMTCDRIPGADADDVMGTLKLATKRLVSPAYMNAGMGDGGGCHPRDQIALSWLAQDLKLPHDPYGVVVEHREAHARWLADLWIDEAELTGLSPIMLGDAYKPNSTLKTGSHARLVAHCARQRADIRVWDTPEDMRRDVPHGAVTPHACWFLATPHDWLLSAKPEGVLIDPWGLFPDPVPEVPPGGMVPRTRLRIIRPGRR